MSEPVHIGQKIVGVSVKTPEAGAVHEADRRLQLDSVPEPPLASLRWAKRPQSHQGNPCWTYIVHHPQCDFGLFIGHMEGQEPYPFEVWVNGAEQPRGLGALAKSLSMDMRSNDRQWLRVKLEALGALRGDDAFDLVMPDGQPTRLPSLVAAFARLVLYRCEQLGAFARAGETPVLNALMFRSEPKAGPGGTLSWTVDVLNPATGDDFALFLKELVMPDGSRRPYELRLAGEYPSSLDGLCRSLSLDMRVVDPAWVGAKLRQLLDYSEPRGDFLARVPGEDKQRNYPSTVAYIAALVLYRFVTLGILREDCRPVVDMGALHRPEVSGGERPVRQGRLCPACGAYAVVRLEGCDTCQACGDSKCG